MVRVRSQIRSHLISSFMNLDGGRRDETCNLSLRDQFRNITILNGLSHNVTHKEIVKLRKGV